MSVEDLNSKACSFFVAAAQALRILVTHVPRDRQGGSHVVREGGSEGSALQQPRDQQRLQVHHRHDRQHHRWGN